MSNLVQTVQTPQKKKRVQKTDPRQIADADRTEIEESEWKKEANTRKKRKNTTQFRILINLEIYTDFKNSCWSPKRI